MSVSNCSAWIMNRTWANDNQQAVVFASHDFVHALAGLGDQALNGRAGDGKEADQMFRGRQHGDVLDALVIGLAGLVVVRHIGHLSALGFHARFLQKRVGGERSERQKKNRRCSAVGSGVQALSAIKPLDRQ